MTVDQLLARTRQLLMDVPYVIVATIDGAEVSTRQVQPLDVTDDLTVLVGTSPRSRKAAAIATNPRATIAIEDFAAFAYASIACAADIVDDLDQRRSCWTEDIAPFFPDGPEGDDFVLMRLVPHRIELMDFTAGIIPDPYGLVPAAIERNGTAWAMAAHPRRP